MTQQENTDNLFQLMTTKSDMKQQVYRNTRAALGLIKNRILELEQTYRLYSKKIKTERDPTPFEWNSIGDFEIELKFGGDVLLFLMHTNVFEFPRAHDVMRTDYIRDDRNRSYCGIINIYNFLADSFKYNRVNDTGYLIGRIFINKENHYFVEGKRELGFLYNNFGKHEFDQEAVDSLLEAAITYTINFDLLTPDYDLVKEVSVYEMKNTMDTISIKTAKRLGFKFQADMKNTTGDPE